MLDVAVCAKGAMIMYRVVFYPLLKQYEPYVDRKLLDAQTAAQDSMDSLQKAGKDALAKQLHAVQQSDVVAKVGQAIINSAVEAQKSASAPHDPTTRSSAKRKEEDASNTTD